MRYLTKIYTTIGIVGVVIGWFMALAPATAERIHMPVTPQSLTCQQPGPPIVGGDRARICRGETTGLTATGCLGTVVWSTGETGASIRVTPYQTTKYTAICRLPEGCVSCFADAYTVTVGTPDAPRISTKTPIVCPGDAATLTVGNCPGTVQWTDGTLTGNSPVVQVRQTTSYQASCRQGECVSSPSTQITIQTTLPAVPLLTRVSGSGEVCVGQSVQLSAELCAGQVRWSDGVVGADRTLTPRQSLRLRAVCRVGTCQSDSSGVLTIAVRQTGETALAQTTVQNTCPYLTADLTTAIGGAFQPTLTYEFRAGPGPDAPQVASSGAVLAGVYYVSARAREGCLSQPVAVSALISPCANGIAPCLSNPPTVSLSLDSLDQKRGVVCLRARVRGVATETMRLESAWSCTGDGLFTGKQTVQPRYVASENDRKTGTVIFALTTPDPDGTGPCLPGAARLVVPVLPTNKGGGIDSSSVVINRPDAPEANTIFIPEGFSPNGDGINDRFVIQGVPATATVDLEIFNRWGHRVFADVTYKNDWDGRANQGIQATASQGLPDGTYFYVVRISDGREFVRFMTIAR